MFEHVSKDIRIKQGWQCSKYYRGVVANMIIHSCQAQNGGAASLLNIADSHLICSVSEVYLMGVYLPPQYSQLFDV